MASCGKKSFAGLVLAALLMAGCAHYPINSPLDKYDPQKGYRIKNMSSPNNSDSFLIILTFSGGGTRAAALSYGVLEELLRTEIFWEGHRKRLLDEVDLVSAVSGGAFTAAYYGLFGERIFNDFESKFLKRDIQKALVFQVLSPLNWFRLASPTFGRSDLTAEYYDKHLFEHKTFADIASRHGPLILVNATDMTLGSWFSFSQDHFDWICSDISKYPVARAVAASSAVPVALTPVTLRNFAGLCGYQIPEWVVEALGEREVPTSTRRFHQALHMASYVDSKKRPYIHLLDGGLADNLGLRTALDRVILIGDVWRAMKETGLKDIRKVAFIVVNAETEPDIRWDLQGAPPSTTQSLKSATSALISRYNFETMELLRNYLEKWTEEIRKQRRDVQDRETDISFYLVEVNFDALKDEGERKYLKALPTSFHLPKGALDRLRRTAQEILLQSKEFQRLLQELR